MKDYFVAFNAFNSDGKWVPCNAKYSYDDSNGTINLYAIRNEMKKHAQMILDLDVKDVVILELKELSLQIPIHYVHYQAFSKPYAMGEYIRDCKILPLNTISSIEDVKKAEEYIKEEFFKDNKENIKIVLSDWERDRAS